MSSDNDNSPFGASGDFDNAYWASQRKEPSTMESSQTTSPSPNAISAQSSNSKHKLDDYGHGDHKPNNEDDDVLTALLKRLKSVELPSTWRDKHPSMILNEICTKLGVTLDMEMERMDGPSHAPWSVFLICNQDYRLIALFHTLKTWSINCVFTVFIKLSLYFRDVTCK